MLARHYAIAHPEHNSRTDGSGAESGRQAQVPLTYSPGNSKKLKTDQQLLSEQYKETGAKAPSYAFSVNSRSFERGHAAGLEPAPLSSHSATTSSVALSPRTTSTSTQNFLDYGSRNARARATPRSFVPQSAAPRNLSQVSTLRQPSYDHGTAVVTWPTSYPAANTQWSKDEVTQNSGMGSADESSFDWLFAAQPDLFLSDSPAMALPMQNFNPHHLVGAHRTSSFEPHVLPKDSLGRFPPAPIALLPPALTAISTDEPLSNNSSEYSAPQGSSLSQEDTTSHPRKRQWPDDTTEIPPPSLGNVIEPVYLDNVDAKVLSRENSYQVTMLNEAARQQILTLPSICDGPETQRRGAEDALRKVDAELYNVFMQLYFQHYDRICPIVHKATFDPEKIAAFLLGAICATGAMHSSIPRAQDFGDMLMNIVSRAIFSLLPHDNRLFRSPEYAQTMLLNFSFFRSAGQRRMLELAESSRSPLATMVRRNHFFDATTHNEEGLSTEEAWKRWVIAETGRRTAWAFYLSDIELSAVWQLQPSISLDEAVAQLPQDDWAWQASSAAAWARLSPGHVRSTSLQQLHAMLGSATDAATISASLAAMQVSDRQCSVFAHSLCSLGLGLRSLQVSCLSSSKQFALDEFSFRCSDFCHALALRSRPQRHGGQGPSAALATAEVIARFSLLRECLDFAEVQVLIGKTGRRKDMHQALQNLCREVQRRPDTLKLGLLHAGRIIYLCTSSSIESTYEAFYVFYAATMLFVAAVAWPRTDFNASRGHHRTVSASPPSAPSATPVCIDAPTPILHDDPVWRTYPPFHGAPSVQPTETTLENLAYVSPLLTSVGSLTQTHAHSRLLKHFGSRLSSQPVQDAWPIERLLGTILGEMASVFAHV